MVATLTNVSSLIDADANVVPIGGVDFLWRQMAFDPEKHLFHTYSCSECGETFKGITQQLITDMTTHATSCSGPECDPED